MSLRLAAARAGLLAAACTTPLSAARAGVAAAAVATDRDGRQDLPIVRVDRDDIRIGASCRLEFATAPVIDANGDGVIHIVGHGIVVDLGGGALVGEAPGTRPWERTGIGIVVQGRDVTIRNGSIRGFHVAVLAVGADGLIAEDLDLSGNRGARLRSTRTAEDGADWLWPHHNDRSEWRTRYGAALCVERARGVTIRRIRAVGGGGQNGIILDRVEDSAVYDSDCSFLSGWGLALWRSSGNVISRNAFDFCVRGYSHGVYNRGQDSAGILMFEQCCDNVIVENSVTHGGDGIFIFAGIEALGPDLPDGAGEDDPAAVAVRGRGCNGNIIARNDFSDAVAHGIEVTFSFDNLIAGNTLRRCGITGIWGGYSRRSAIIDNLFDSNGVHATNPGEEAGLSAEHAGSLVIAGNTFQNQGVAIKLWWDEDPALLRKAWAVANGHECAGNLLVENTFVACTTAVQVRDCRETILGDQTLVGTQREVDSDAASAPRRLDGPQVPPSPLLPRSRPDSGPVASLREHLLGELPQALEAARSRAMGDARPIGARAQLAGRERIVMTEQGPYGWSSPLLVLESTDAASQTWRVLGPLAMRGAQIRGQASLDLEHRSTDGLIRVLGRAGWVAPYRLSVTLEGQREPLVGHGVVVSAPWNARFFAWTVDPREDLDGWRREAQGEGAISVELPALDLRHGHGGPSQIVHSDAVRKADLPRDRFGMIATTRLHFPAGRWRVRLTSDDGVRLRADGNTLIERWDRHAPTEDIAEIHTGQPRQIELEIEHFELDGFAVLTFSVEPIPSTEP